jgi:hypothetical protein
MGQVDAEEKFVVYQPRRRSLICLQERLPAHFRPQASTLQKAKSDNTVGLFRLARRASASSARLRSRCPRRIRRMKAEMATTCRINVPLSAARSASSSARLRSVSLMPLPNVSCR